MADYSGRFVLRIPPDLHARATRAARALGVSLNEYCRAALEASADGVPRGRCDDRHAGWVEQARVVVGADLEGLVLFGSQARGEGRPSSDIDLLIVVSSSLELSRDLYRRWDTTDPDPRVSPHFVHRPERVLNAGSIWYEVALDGVILYDPSGQTADFLRTVRRAIADGRLRRRYTHGHPYWVKHPEVTNAQ